MTLHRHAPVPTGVLCKAGFRKDNVPRGAWSFLCESELLRCSSCRQLLCKVELSGREQIVEIETVIYDGPRDN